MPEPAPVQDRAQDRAPDRAPDRVPPARVTMPLLTLITQQSLEEDYLHVAERRALRAAQDPQGAAQPAQRSSWGWRHLGAAVVLVLFGGLVATAAAQTSANQDVNDASRTTLISQVEAGRAEVSDLQDQIFSLRGRISALDQQRRTLRETQDDVESRLRRLQVNTGLVAVTGPGVRISVDDPPDADDIEAVRADDLRTLVNGLWEAGAEAISVDGQRLTNLSAFSNSGVAIQVNGSPLSPPYVVQAIGDVRSLQADLADSTSGIQFQALVDQYGFGVTRQNVDSMTLPSAPASQLRLRDVKAGTSDTPHQPDQETP